MRKITVHVTQEDIDNSIPEDDCECPIANALIRLFPDSQVSVDVAVMGPDAGHALAEIDGVLSILPDECREFIELFDNLPPAQARPFSFEMEVAG